MSIPTWAEIRANAGRMRSPLASPIITRPFEPFKSPVDGSMISDSAQRTEHNRRNDVIDVGDDPAALAPSAPAVSTMPVESDMLDSHAQRSGSTATGRRRFPCGRRRRVSGWSLSLSDRLCGLRAFPLMASM